MKPIWVHLSEVMLSHVHDSLRSPRALDQAVGVGENCISSFEVLYCREGLLDVGLVVIGAYTRSLKGFCKAFDLEFRKIIQGQS